MNWWSSEPPLASGRVLRGPRVSATRPATLLIDPEKLRRFQPPSPNGNGNGHEPPEETDQAEQPEEVEEPEPQPAYDPVAEAAKLEQLAIEIEAVRQEGTDEGYKRGFADGREAYRSEIEEDTRRAEDERETRVHSAAVALLSAVERVEEARAEAVQVAERECAELAFKLTRALVGRETHLAENPTVDAIVRALNLAPTNEAVVIRLNPEDITTLSGFDMSRVGRECTIVPDTSIERSGCVVEAGATRIDAQMGRALGRVRKVLLGHHHGRDTTSEVGDDDPDADSTGRRVLDEVPA